MKKRAHLSATKYLLAVVLIVLLILLARIIL
jgi:hypothetical protein